MSLLSNVYSFVFSDIRTTLISLLIGLIVYKIVKFYVLVLSLPPGPIPIPLFGNLLYFRGSKNHWSIDLEAVRDKYGPVFTFWMGSKPSIFIADIDIARKAFRGNDFAGRPVNLFGSKCSNDNYTDVTFADYGPAWEALRRVAHSAVLKYSSTDKLVNLVCDVVDQTIETIIEKEGINISFKTIEYNYHLLVNIMATSAFGKVYKWDDPEYKQIKYMQKDFFEEFGQRFFFWEFFKIFQKIDSKGFNHFNRKMDDFIDILKNKFKSHYEDYDESVIRDFCDTLISAKNDALREGKESAHYLNDSNLSMTIFDLFFAGTDTSTLNWILLLLAYYPEIQKKLRQEIESQIGDRLPTHEDRNRCHYVMAFIAETLRFRNVVPVGVPHSAVVNSKIGNYSIPKGQQVLVFQGSISRDEKYWPNGQEFKPERFLENGKYITTRPKAFIPFGVGRRVCLGEKLATADLFLILVRILQKTCDYELVLHNNDDLEFDPNDPIKPNPKPYEISLRKI